MRFGVCASYRDVATLDLTDLDYLEEGVQRFLVPEQPQAEFEAHRQRARALPIPIEAANALLPADLKVIDTPSQRVDRPRLTRYIQTALARAEQAGLRVLVFGSGAARAVPADISHAEAERQIGELLAQWGEWAREHGVTIVLEPLRTEETNIFNTVVESGVLIARLVTPGARLLADTYHMACNGEDPASLTDLVPLLAHVHVAEHQDRAAPGTYGEDLRPSLAVLRRGGYDARISIECHWRDLSAQLSPALARVRAQWLSADL